MTKPPCYNDGKDCPRRCVSCRASCEDYHKWLAIHAQEKAAMQRDKAQYAEYVGYAKDAISRRSRKVGQR